MKVLVTYDDTLYQLVPKEPTLEMLDKGAMEIAMNNQRVATAESKAMNVYRALLSAATTPPAQPAERMPLTDEGIQEILKIGNPSEEACRLIRLGWNAAHGIKGES